MSSRYETRHADLVATAMLSLDEKKGGHFEKVGDDDYVGPSGRHFNYNQVRAYYSNGGSWDGIMSEAALDDANGDRGDVAPPAAGMPRSMASRCMSCGADMRASDASGSQCADCSAGVDDADRPGGGMTAPLNKPGHPRNQSDGSGAPPPNVIQPRRIATVRKHADVMAPNAGKGIVQVPSPAVKKAVAKGSLPAKVVPPPAKQALADHHVMVPSKGKDGKPGVYYAKSTHGSLDEALDEASKHAGAFVQGPGGKKHALRAAPGDRKFGGMTAKANRTPGSGVKMDWMPAKQFEKQQQGLKKSVATRKKQDKADAAKAAAMKPVPVPLKPVQMGGPGSGPHPGQAAKAAPSRYAHLPAGAPLPANATPAERYAHQTKSNAAMQKSGLIGGKGVAPQGGKFKDTPAKTSADHPINPLKIRPPKGSAPAPGKTIGAIHAAPGGAAPAAAPSGGGAAMRARRQ